MGKRALAANGKGRTHAIKTIANDALLERTGSHFASIFGKRPVGLTLQIDEGTEVYDAKHSNLHPLFNKN